MERISSQVQLSSVLSAIDKPSGRQLPVEELTRLSLVVEQTFQRYPSQDVEESLTGYLWDFERLAIRYSTQEVIAALAELRITPGQTFFPRPDEVAGEIEHQRNHRYTDQERKSASMRQETRKAERARLMSTDEVSWRIEHFGYDPFAGKL